MSPSATQVIGSAAEQEEESIAYCIASLSLLPLPAFDLREEQGTGELVNSGGEIVGFCIPWFTHGDIRSRAV